MRSKYFFGLVALMMLFIGSGCNMDYRSKDNGESSSSTNDETQRLSQILYLRSSDIDVKTELITSKNDENVISLAEGQYDYTHYKFTKNGGSSSDVADSTGINATVLTRNGSKLTLKGSLVISSGDHAHGVFSHGNGTSVEISDCVATMMGNNSSGLITSAGGTITANHVTAETFGSSSPAIYVYEGGGSISAQRGKYSTYGASSPAIRSEGIISVSDAKLEALSSQATVVDGQSSVTLSSCDVSANHSAEAGTGNSRCQAVLMYMDSSGNPLANTGYFSMDGGTLSNTKGDVFFVTNSSATITLKNVDITNHDSEGAFLRAEASSFGTAGVNGGYVELTASDQFMEGNIYLDNFSDMNMYLKDDSYFTGAVNNDNTNARIYVSISGAKWILMGDSYIDSLTCEENSINLNGHNLYVAGEAYTAGTKSTGVAIDFTSSRTKTQ